MRKTEVTFVNRDKRTTYEKIKDFVGEEFNQEPFIRVQDNRIMRVSFFLGESDFSIIDSYGESTIYGLPSNLSIHTFNLISRLVKIIEENNNYYDELADFYIQK